MAEAKKARLAELKHARQSRDAVAAGTPFPAAPHPRPEFLCNPSRATHNVRPLAPLVQWGKQVLWRWRCESVPSTTAVSSTLGLRALHCAEPKRTHPLPIRTPHATHHATNAQQARTHACTHERACSPLAGVCAVCSNPGGSLLLPRRFCVSVRGDSARSPPTRLGSHTVWL